ncbi:MAG TPA: GNAT family N-acetyltransferase [Solirubrobacteraceae bacterium]|nr:GNAT family N-acetyltransferase [Solirubrobacteraceae bacterium]
MSPIAPIEPDVPPGQARPGPSWRVRTASREDLAAVVAAVRELLLELGSTPPPTPALEETARALLDDPKAGALLVAEADGAIVGVLCASWQIAIHVPGRYALIQDLWVHPSRRGQAVGGELLAAIFALAREQGMARVEVGLPRERYQGIRATEAFYLHNGFAPLGARMRRIL